MAGVRDNTLVSATGFPGGVANVPRETSVPPTHLRAAINADLDDTGKPVACAGHTLIVETLDARGLWKHDAWPFALFARGDDLCALHPNETVEVLATGLSVETPSFALCAGTVYWSDGNRIGRILENGTVLPVGCEQPAGQPTVTAAAVGGLAAGVYQVAITYTDTWGTESGSSLAIEIELTEGQGLQLSNIPQPTSGHVAEINLFATQPNGTTLIWRRSIPPAITSWVIGVGQQGRELETQFMTPMPPGQFLAYFMGHLLVASGDTLYVSEPLRYGLVSKRFRWTRYPPRINGVVPVTDAAAPGVYVGAGERTYWCAGADPRAWQRVIAYAADIVPGTALLVPGDVMSEELGSNVLVGYWLANDGQFCVGHPGGNVELLQDRMFLADPATSGASVLRDINGVQSVLTVADRTATSRAKFSDSLSNFVIRNGVELA